MNPSFGNGLREWRGELSPVIHRFIHIYAAFVDKFRAFSDYAVGFPQERQKYEKLAKKAAELAMGFGYRKAGVCGYRTQKSHEAKVLSSRSVAFRCLTAGPDTR
jgi:hypothetical protein